MSMICRDTSIKRALAHSKRAQRGWALVDPYRFAAPDASAQAIWTSLTAWWEFNDNDATAGSKFLDAHTGAHHLTPVKSGVTSTTSANTTTGFITLPHGSTRHYGLINETTFLQQHAYIPRANTTFDLANASFSIWYWAKGDPANDGGSRFGPNRWGSDTSGRQWCIIHSNASDQKFYAGVQASDATTTFIGPSTAAMGAGDTNDWCLVVFSLDRTNNTLTLWIKGPAFGDPGTAINDKITAAFAKALNTTAGNANFTFGQLVRSNNTYDGGNRRHFQASGGYASGGFAVGLAMTDTIVNYIWNSGNGKNYAQMKLDSGH